MSNGKAQGMSQGDFNEFYRQKRFQENASDYDFYQNGIDVAPEAQEAIQGQGVVESKRATPAQLSQNQGASEVSQVGDITTKVGAASGQPEIMALGLGLQTMGQIQQGKQNQRNAQYAAEVAKINARQDAINRMAQIGAGLKA